MVRLPENSVRPGEGSGTASSAVKLLRRPVVYQ
jgi:hypothetical protein